MPPQSVIQRLARTYEVAQVLTSAVAGRGHGSAGSATALGAGSIGVAETPIRANRRADALSEHRRADACRGDRVDRGGGRSTRPGPTGAVGLLKQRKILATAHRGRLSELPSLIHMIVNLEFDRRAHRISLSGVQQARDEGGLPETDILGCGQVLRREPLEVQRLPPRAWLT